MATVRFANANTAQTRNSAITAFERFLSQNQLTLDAIHSLVREDESGRAFFQVMDRFALHLLTSEGARGNKLAHGTAMLYFGSVKNWMYAAHAGLEQKMERQVSKISGTMDRRFKSQAPVISKQAPACKRSDLQALVSYLLTTAGSEDDYWDCALLVMMWHLFGRSSDMHSLSKQSFALHPGGCVSVRFGRQKTSLEQGLSLFPAMDMLICPIHTLSVAVAADIVPSERLFRQLPRGALVDEEDYDEDELPLLDLIQGTTATVLDGRTASVARSAPGIHAYINRLLRRLSTEISRHSTALTPNLSSHSFRRGGAQAANGNPNVSLQWIFDRGGWQLSAVNKALVYIFNTTNEDRQVAKVLSGWEPLQTTWVPTLTPLDDGVLPTVRAFCRVLFHIDTTPEVPEFLFHPSLVDCMGATIIYHYPDMMKLTRHGPFPRAVRVALGKVGVTENELVAWSLVLRHHWLNLQSQPQKVNHSIVAAAPTSSEPEPLDDKSMKQLLFEQTDLIRVLVERTKMLDKRVEDLERSLRTGQYPRNGPVNPGVDSASDEDEKPTGPGRKKRKTGAMDATEAWFKWYGSAPPLWEDKKSVERQRFSEIRLVVAYMRLFVGPYVLDRESSSYPADVMRVGDQGAAALLGYLQQMGSNAKSVGTILRAMQKFDSCGALDSRRNHFMLLLRSADVLDPTPVDLLLPNSK